MITLDDVLRMDAAALAAVDDPFASDDDDLIDDSAVIDDAEAREAYERAELAAADRGMREYYRELREDLAAAGKDLLDVYHESGRAEDLESWDRTARLLGMGRNWQDNAERRARDRERRADAAAYLADLRAAGVAGKASDPIHQPARRVNQWRAVSLGNLGTTLYQLTGKPAPERKGGGDWLNHYQGQS